MKLTRKNNALTNDVVAMYDSVGYGEACDSAIAQMAANTAPYGAGVSLNIDGAPFYVKVGVLVWYGVHSVVEWLG